jgi:hypothetical protein
MKKVSPRRVVIGTPIGAGLIFAMIEFLNWFTSPDFPLWSSNGERCAEETFEQPYISQEYYYEFFEYCLMQSRAEEGENIPIPTNKPVIIEEAG